MFNREETLAFLKSFDWDTLSDKAVRRLAADVRQGALKIDEYNPEKKNETCRCGHPYHRHFDFYENHSDQVGCKYCGCATFRAPESGMHVMIAQRFDHNGVMSINIICVEGMLEWPFSYCANGVIEADSVSSVIDYAEQLMRFEGEDEIVLTSMAEAHCSENGWISMDMRSLMEQLEIQRVKKEPARKQWQLDCQDFGY